MVDQFPKLPWTEWCIVRQIGEGTFGKVFEAIRTDHGMQNTSAIKVIPIPQKDADVEILSSEGLSPDDTRTSLLEKVNDCVNEIQLMESFKGVQNIVSIEDYRVVEKQDTLGWDIFIRMEFLTPLKTYFKENPVTEDEVIRLGCEVCTALELFAQQNVIHRDIKPGNLFVHPFGYFKVGDFGIARKLENPTSSLSCKGALPYMAPEIMRGETYDATVDQYSLGLVLYQYRNKRRLPFLDTEKQILTFREREAALDKRKNGEPLPPPCEASPELADVILRACDPNPMRRFASATEMKEALLKVERGIYHLPDLANEPDILDKTKVVRRAKAQPTEDKSTFSAQHSSAPPFEPSAGGKGHLRTAIIALAIMVALVATGAYLLFFRDEPDVEEMSESTPTITVNATEITTVVPIEIPPESLTEIPTEAPTKVLTEAPTEIPTKAPTEAPTTASTEAPTEAPTISPTEVPTETSTDAPTAVPAETSTIASTEDTTTVPTPIPVTFDDQAIESAVRGALGMASGPIVESDLAHVKILNLSGAGVSNLSDLALLQNLESLSLANNSIKDISPIAGLHALVTLDLGINDITDISALSGLTGLTTLGLTDNAVSDLSALSNLSALKRLYLGGNPISDLSALSGLTNLERLHLDHIDTITDLSPLSALTNLKAYAGPEIPWPTSADAVIVCLWADDGTNTVQAKDSLETAFLASGIDRTGSVTATKAQSGDFLIKCIEGKAGIDHIDGICIFAFEDVDYSEAVAKAVVNGVAIHIMSATEPEDIHSEICSLYNLSTKRVCLTEIEPVSYSRYTGNEGDSTYYYLDKSKPSPRGGVTRNGNKGLNGELFEDGLEIWIARWNFKSEESWVSIGYQLDGQYHRLVGQTGLITSPNTTQFDMTLQFIADGESVLSVRLTPSSVDKDFSVNLDGVQKLEILLKDTVAVSRGTSIALHNVYLE